MNYKNRSKGISWRPARKSEPWHAEAVMWSEICHMFPVTWGPCEAIKYTARKMKQMGLMSCSNEDFTTSQIHRIKKMHMKDWKKEAAV
jgi:hypothetical protein